ncbi:MAG: LOG family protein [Thermodesulfobacteriota bacterium]
MGSSSADEDSAAGRRAYMIGRLVAQRGGVIFTGGCAGLPHAAVRGALDAGGTTVAVSPAMNLDDHCDLSMYGCPSDSTITVLTGMGTKGRNVVLVRSADACVFVGGGMGTLNEFTIAYDELPAAAAIGVLLDSGGLSSEYARLATAVQRAPEALLIRDEDPDRLLAAIFDHLRTNTS